MEETGESVLAMFSWVWLPTKFGSQLGYRRRLVEVLLDGGHDVELVTRFNSLFPMTFYNLDQAYIYGRVFG